MHMEFIEITPAHGEAYYDSKNDRAVIIYKARNETKIYSGRIAGRDGKYACCFSNCEVVKNA